jgi:hypothetical protein
MNIGAIVIMTQNLADMCAFYNDIGFTLNEEQHPAGPVHYAISFQNHVVMEFYPTTNPLQKTSCVKLIFYDAPVADIRKAVENTNRLQNLMDKGSRADQIKIMDPVGNILIFLKEKITA